MGQSFLIMPGESAEQQKIRRELAAKMLEEGSSYSPVSHWTQALARAMQGATGGYDYYQAGEQDRREKAEGNQLLDSLFGGQGAVSGATAAAPGGPVAAPAAGGTGALADRLMQAESGGNATATNPNSSAAGAGQFINSTWLSMLRKYRPDLAGRSDPELLAMRSNKDLSREMTDAYARENGTFLQSKGLPVSDASLSLAHFAGPAGAAAILQAPAGTPIERVMSVDAMRANPWLAGKTTDQVAEWAGRRVAAAPARSSGLPEDGSDRMNIALKLMKNRTTAPIGNAIFQAELTREKAKPTVVPPGSTVLDGNGRPIYTAPAEGVAEKARQQKLGEARGTAEASIPTAVGKAQSAVEVLNKLRVHKGLDSGTGLTGVAARKIPGTDAYAFDTMNEQARGGMLLQAMEDMRGTGAISNAEGDAGKAAIGRMDAAQGKADYLEAVDDYQRILARGVLTSYVKAGITPPPEVLQAITSGLKPASRDARAPDQPDEAGVQVPPAAVEYLRQNPDTRPAFEAKYGRGVADKVLGAGAGAGPASPQTGARAAKPDVSMFSSEMAAPLWPLSKDRALLKRRPELAAAFDARFGEGAADKVLGRKTPSENAPNYQGAY